MPDRRRSVPELGRVERVVAMRRFPGAAELHASELSVLASVARPRRVLAGEALCVEGEALHAIFLVVQGIIVVRSHGLVLDRAGPGAAIGALAALARDPQGLDCRAADDDAVVLSISLEDLEDVLEEVPSMLVPLLVEILSRAPAGMLGRELGVRRPSVLVPPSERTIDLVERIFYLRNCPLFARVSIDAVAALAAVARETRHAGGQALFRQGERADSLYVIVAGEVEVGPAGARPRFSAGDLVGDAETFVASVHPSDALAVGNVIALGIDRGAFLDVCEDHVDLAVEVMRHESAAVLAAHRALAVSP